MNKYHHSDIVHAKVDIMAHQVNVFIDMFDPLFKKGLPLFLEEKGTMLTQKEYQEKLIQCRLDHTNFTDINQSLSGKTIVDKLADEFYSYTDHIESCVLVNEMCTLELPSADQWKTV